jgi:WhiB family redox-sensing transcriptional regulator
MTGPPEVSAIRGPGWRESAACRGKDPEMFFPERGRSIRAAMAVCAACPVAAPCLSETLASDWVEDRTNGIRGGLTAEHRRLLRQRSRRKLA